MARVKVIKKIPKALSGLEMKMNAGLYGKGTNGNSQFRKNGHLEAGKISQQPTQVRDTLLPVDRKDANLEAERGETAIVNIDGIPAHFKIGGKRHSKGGTPLNLPDNSFIFSDTAKMKIKDPIMLAQFGMVPKPSGYTPAEIAKKYDINKYRQLLADPNTDTIDTKTAEIMISNCNMKLAKLALLQESMKGFPQGIPVIAMPYITEMDMNPEEFVSTQGQVDEPDADMGVSKYGGGLYKAQNGYINKTKDIETAKKFAESSDPLMAKFYDAFQAATKNPNITPKELNALADQMENYDAVGWGWVPGSFQDRLEDLASRLRDRAKPDFNKQDPTRELEANYKKREQETLSKTNKLYLDLISKRSKVTPTSSEYFKLSAEMDKLLPYTSGLVEKYPYKKEVKNYILEKDPLSGSTNSGPFFSGRPESDIEYIPAKLYSEGTMADIDKRYSELEAEKKKLSVLQPAIKKTEVTKEKEAAVTAPAAETKTVTTPGKVANKPSAQNEDLRQISDADLMAELEELEKSNK
jgi:hypothetical protein